MQKGGYSLQTRYVHPVEISFSERPKREADIFMTGLQSPNVAKALFHSRVDLWTVCRHRETAAYKDKAHLSSKTAY